MATAGTQITRKLRAGWDLLAESFRCFKSKRGPLMSAAVAFYTLLAVAPLLVVGLAVVAAVFGTETERQELASSIGRALGYEPAPMINDWLVQASKAPGVASAVGVVVALVMSTRLFTQLEEALDEVWDLEPKKPAGLRKKVETFLKRRLLAFAMVLGSGLMLLALVVARGFIEATGDDLFTSAQWTRGTVGAVELVFSVGAAWLGATVCYRVLPHCEVPWRSAWAGGLLASILLNVGFLFLGWYVGLLVSGSSFGPTAAFVFLLVWLYYSAQILMLGANLTRVHARQR